MARSHSIDVLASIAIIVVASNLVFSPVAPNVAVTAIAHGQSNQRPIGYADIVDKVKPAVVSLRVKADADTPTLDDGLPSFGDLPVERSLQSFGQPANPHRSLNPPSRQLMTRQGSGFFISADGYVVTNGHIVENAKTAAITTDDGKTYSAKVIGSDSRTDIALTKVEGTGFPFVKFAETSPRVGDLVLAIGNPFGLGGTVTAGIVSARGRDIGDGPYEDFIQIDASVNRGNSGGPTFDMNGNVIGMNTAILSPSSGSVGLAFAAPAEVVKDIVTQLREKGAVSRGWIGVMTPDVAESLGLKEQRGALVAEPEVNGPAAKAGVEAGDVITVVNGKAIADSHELARAISHMSPGSLAQVTILRKGQDKTIGLILGKLPEQRDAKAIFEVPRRRGTNVPQLGLSVAPRAGGDGVVVFEVDPDGAAAERDVQTGDVILEAAGRKISSPTDLRRAIDGGQKGKHSVFLQIKAVGATKLVALPIGHG
jgi:serine protease Do